MLTNYGTSTCQWCITFWSVQANISVELFFKFNFSYLDIDFSYIFKKKKLLNSFLNDLV